MMNKQQNCRLSEVYARSADKSIPTQQFSTPITQHNASWSATCPGRGKTMCKMKVFWKMVIIIMTVILGVRTLAQVTPRQNSSPLTSRTSPIEILKRREVINGNVMPGARKFKMSALDCRAPTATHSSSLSEACETKITNHQLISRHQVTLVQLEKSKTRTALRCSKRESSFLLLCGSFSHTKLAQPPSILAPKVISESECESIFDSKIYVDEVQHSHHIPSTRSEISYKYLAHGEVSYSPSNVFCQGGKTMLNGEEHTNLLDMRTVVIRIETVEVGLRHDDTVADLDLHSMLPAKCATAQSCTSPLHTYYFIDRHSKCEYKNIRTVHADLVQGQIENRPVILLIANQTKTLIPLPSMAGVPASGPCQGHFRQMVKTTHDELAIVFEEDILDLQSMQTVSGADISIDLETKLSDAYLDYTLRRSISEDLLKLGGGLCKALSSQFQQAERSPFHKDQLLRTRGEVIEELSCTPITVTAQEGDNAGGPCYKDAIPVSRGSEHFIITANNRLIITPSKIFEVPCSKATSPLFITNEGVVITAYPEVTEVTIALNHGDPLIHAMNLDKNQASTDQDWSELLYSKSEVNSYSEYLHYSSVKDALTLRMTREYCSNTDECGSYQPENGLPFSLDNLEKEIDSWDLLEKAKNYIKDAGAYCGFLLGVYAILSLFHQMVTILKFRCRGFFWRDSFNLARGRNYSAVPPSTSEPGANTTSVSIQLPAQQQIPMQPLLPPRSTQQRSEIPTNQPQTEWNLLGAPPDYHQTGHTQPKTAQTGSGVKLPDATNPTGGVAFYK